jgi:hypothetical protein
MYINYGVQEVMRKVSVDIVESFCFTITLPVAEVRVIVERNFNHAGDYGYAEFNKISAIKDLRGMVPRYNPIGLREAKEMVEAVWEEGRDAGKYHTSKPQTLKPYEAEGDRDNHMATADTLPF